MVDKSKLRRAISIATGNIILLVSSITPVFAQGTIRSYFQFRNQLKNGELGSFADGLSGLINVGKNIGIILMVFAFILNVFSMIMQANKLGTTNVMGPEFNAAKKQQAYEGLGHAILAFAVIGASVEIFSWLMGFLIGG